jgi:hypothetical protein
MTVRSLVLLGTALVIIVSGTIAGLGMIEGGLWLLTRKPMEISPLCAGLGWTTAVMTSLAYHKSYPEPI